MLKRRYKTKSQRRHAQEEREAIYARDHGHCLSCGGLVPYTEMELAHRIADTVSNRLRWGARVIDHPWNRVTTHRGRCNDRQNIGFRPLEAQALADAILADLEDRDPDPTAQLPRLDDEPDICAWCNGSGEGMADGTTCSHCKGSGVEPVAEERDHRGEAMDRAWEGRHERREP